MSTVARMSFKTICFPTCVPLWAQTHLWCRRQKRCLTDVQSTKMKCYLDRNGKKGKISFCFSEVLKMIPAEKCSSLLKMSFLCESDRLPWQQVNVGVADELQPLLTPDTRSSSATLSDFQESGLQLTGETKCYSWFLFKFPNSLTSTKCHGQRKVRWRRAKRQKVCAWKRPRVNAEPFSLTVGS